MNDADSENTTTVLVVEDDPDVRETTTLVLEANGYTVTAAEDGIIGLQIALDQQPDIAIVDVAMPGMDGLRLTQRLRDLGTPVILLTARDLPSDIVNGLDAGADDYLTKPFDGAVLTARIRAVLRRPGRTTDALETVGPLQLDRDAHTVTVDAALVSLSDTEYRLFTLLMDYRGQVLTRGQILDDLWPDTVGDPRLVDTNIQRLRRRIGDDVIRTVRGTGYIVDRA